MAARGQAFNTGHGACGLGVALHEIFAAPAIELEHLRFTRSACSGHDRPGIAQPDVPRGDLDDLPCPAGGKAR